MHKTFVSSTESRSALPHRRYRVITRASGQEPVSREPPFIAVQKTPVYEIRLYKPYPVGVLFAWSGGGSARDPHSHLPPYASVETPYERRDEGFDRLGSYLGGQNDSGLRFWSTQPVVMLIPGSDRAIKTMQLFLLPRDAKDLTPDQMPAPIHPEVGISSSLVPYVLARMYWEPNTVQVRLGVAGGEVLAALRFEGNATPEVVQVHKTKLLQALAQDGFVVADPEETRIAQYGAVFSLSRTNEVLCKVKL